uniref:Uncharacterized protein n=1 Tax=Anguilla anguilla TaxID=7936 RepID=A0A0E9WT78_ANGAN
MSSVIRFNKRGEFALWPHVSRLIAGLNCGVQSQMKEKKWLRSRHYGACRMCIKSLK